MIFKFKYFHFIFLFILTLIPFIISANKDYVFFYGYGSFKLYNLFSLWIPKDFGSIPGYFAPVYYLYYFFVFCFGHKFGTILIWYLFYNIGILGIILTYREIAKFYNIQTSHLDEFIVGLFYFGSIPGQFLPLMPFTFNLPYAFFPIVVYLLFKLVNQKSKKILYYSLLLSIVLYFALGMQIVFLFYIFLGIFLLLIYFYFQKRILLKEAIILLLTTIVSYLVLSLPFYYSNIILPLMTQSSLVSQSLSLESLQFTQSNSILVEVFKIMGMTSFYYNFNNQYSIPSAVVYFTSPFYIFLSYIGIISFILFLITSWKKKTHFFALFLLVLFVIIIFFMSGSRNITIISDIYTFLYNYVPFFGVFRDSYKVYFLLLFIFSISMGFLLANFHFKTKTSFIIKIAIIALLIIFTRPLYDSNFYQFLDPNTPVEIINSAKYINNNLDYNSRVLVLPLTPFPAYTFINNGFDPYEITSNGKVISEYSSAGQNALLTKLSNRNVDINSTLENLGINYIMWNDYVDLKKYKLSSIYGLRYLESHYKLIKKFNNKIYIFKVQ